MNFTIEQFLDVFQRYNEAIWPLQIVAYALGLLLVALAVRGGATAGRVIAGVLGVTWIWMGAAYHWTFFTDINRAAWLFGALMIGQGVLLLVLGSWKGRLQFERGVGWMGWIGLGMVAFAMLAYPLIGAALGHGYPRAPMFGVAPCPTTIFTFGLFMLAARRSLALVWLPLLWATIGLFAALKLGVREDLGLFVSAVVGTVLTVRADVLTRRSGRATAHAASGEGFTAHAASDEAFKAGAPRAHGAGRETAGLA
jgi:hypothetical protein